MVIKTTSVVSSNVAHSHSWKFCGGNKKKKRNLALLWKQTKTPRAWMRLQFKFFSQWSMYYVVEFPFADEAHYKCGFKVEISANEGDTCRDFSCCQNANSYEIILNRLIHLSSSGWRGKTSSSLKWNISNQASASAFIARDIVNTLLHQSVRPCNFTKAGSVF